MQNRFFLFIFTFPFLIYGGELKEFLPSDAKVFDVGANIGNKTAYYLSLGAHQVICIEPHPQVLITLQDRYQYDSRVIIVPRGLSDQPGIVSFFPARSSTISTMAADWMTGRFKNEIWESQIEVPVVTLDAIIAEYGVPDFCKIDVEGYELNVLMGLTHRIPFLSFEFTYEFLEQKTKPSLDRLTQLEFTHFNVSFGESDHFAFEDWIDSDTLFSFLKNSKDNLSWGDIYAH